MKHSLIENTSKPSDELDQGFQESGSFVTRILGYLGGFLIGLLYSTTRISNVKTFFDPQEKNITDKPVILLFWHEKIILTARCQKKIQTILGDRTIYSLISGHKDGRLLAYALSVFGLRSVPGSSTRGGGKALVSLKNLIQKGFHIAITPDGPRGPRRQMKGGAIKLAQLSGSYIVPIGTSVNRAWQLGSWDKMTLPKPFSKISIAFGEPIKIDRRVVDGEFNNFISQVEKSLLNVTEWTDQIPNV